MTAPEPTATPPPAAPPDYRRERWIVGLSLGVVVLVLSGVSGIVLGTWLTGRSAAHAEQVAQMPLPSPKEAPSIGGVGYPLIMGSGVQFDAEAFPAARFTPPPRQAEPDPEAGAADGEIIEESDFSGGTNLLEGASSATGESSDSGEIFFGARPPDADSLFDLGAGDPSTETAPVAPSTTASRFSISLGTFESRLNADLLVKELLGKGFSAAVSERTEPDGSVRFRVSAGVFTDKELATSLVGDLRAAGFAPWLAEIS